MGNNIAPCILNATTIVVESPYELRWLKTCDPWIVAHFLAPFWLTVLTRSFAIGLLFTHVWETIEMTSQSVFGSYVLFVNANDQTEGIAFILEDILQGLFACLLGKVFLWAYRDAPKVIDFRNLNADSARYWKPIRFILYVLAYLIAIAPGASILGLTTGDTDEIPIGLILYTPLFLLGMLPIVWATWRWERWDSWLEYWTMGLGFSVIMGVQHIWDYFYSRALQSWLYAMAFLIILLLREGNRRQ